MYPILFFSSPTLTLPSFDFSDLFAVSPLPRRRASRRFLSPSQYNLEWRQLRNGVKVAIQPGVVSQLCKSTLVSEVDGGVYDTTCRGLCKIQWCLEADIADGYLLFITGDPVTLGCWEPKMGILLSPCEGHDNLWMTEIKVPCGIFFKYNYFIREEKNPHADVVWRSGPEFSLSIPSAGGINETIVVRDFWMRSRIQGSPMPSWGSWLVDAYLNNYIKLVGGDVTPVAGQHDVLKSLNGVPAQGHRLSVHFMSEEKSILKDMVSGVSTGNLDGFSESGNLDRFSEREQPVEEPWFLQSVFLRVTGEPYDPPSHSMHENELLRQSQEAEIQSSQEQKEDLEKPASTVILINSSVCTMQRIAVLEDEKLVELLLEPVKNTVQCDSIYLGVVTKFVPHMGGAFVDIGISRPSLMDVKKNREPFVYPPLHYDGVSVDDYTCLESKELLEIHEHDDHSYDVDDVTDELLEADPDNSLQINGENRHEIEDNLDAVVAHNLSFNLGNASIELNNAVADSEENSEGTGDNVEEHAEDFVPVEVENIEDELPLLLQQSVKEPGDTNGNKGRWSHVREGTKIIVQVVKEGLGTKGPALTAYPTLRSRFWILLTRCNRIGVSKKITGTERTRLKVIAKSLQPPGFGLTVRTVASGHSMEELKKDFEGLLSTWKAIVEHAKSAALAAEEGVEGAVPVILHKAMGQTLYVVQDYFNEKVKCMVVDSPRTYHEVTSYLQEIAPDLCNRVELYEKRIPIFDEYNIEEEINNILSKRVPLSNGGYLVIEQTEALVSIDVNGGYCMLGDGTSQEKAVLEVNLAAAKQIARELRLRDIGGIIVVDFIDMTDESNRKLVYEEMKMAVERDRSTVRVSELSKNGLMEITRKRVRPSVTFMISEPCTCCHATGRVEALETSFSKIEHEICRLLAVTDEKPDPGNAKSWPRFVLKVDRHMGNYLTSGKRTKLAVLCSSLKVWILLKVARGFPRGSFEVKSFSDVKADNEKQNAISRLLPAESRTNVGNTKLTVFPVKKWRTQGK